MIKQIKILSHGACTCPIIICFHVCFSHWTTGSLKDKRFLCLCVPRILMILPGIWWNHYKLLINEWKKGKKEKAYSDDIWRVASSHISHINANSLPCLPLAQIPVPTHLSWPLGAKVRDCGQCYLSPGRQSRLAT